MEQFAVIDMSAIIAAPSGAVVEPADWQIVTPDPAAHEAVENRRPDQQATKLLSFCKLHVERLHLAHHPQVVIRRDLTTMASVSIAETLLAPTNRNLARDVVRVAGTVTPEHVQAGRNYHTHVGYEGDRQDFLRFCEDARKVGILPERERNLMRSDPAQRASWIRQPVLLRTLLPDKAIGTRLRNTFRASRFPDGWAIRRFARIQTWYAMRRWLEHADRLPNGFANNFDDLHYAFSASYTRRLITNDAGLREAVAAVFPQCEVMDSAAVFRRARP